MITIRKRNDIFVARESWFEGRWHFSFDRYYDTENTSFGALRVFNVDTLVPGGVWPMHPHRDIEVITYCLDGEFEHADSLGNGGVLYPGDVQHTTVGSGMYHSEVNHSPDRPMTFLQVWIMPSLLGLPPSVEQRRVQRQERLNRFLTLASGTGRDALPIRQDAEFVVSALEPGGRGAYALGQGYGAYLYVASGAAAVNGQLLSEGDAAKVAGEPSVVVVGEEESELAMVVVRV